MGDFEVATYDCSWFDPSTKKQLHGKLLVSKFKLLLMFAMFGSRKRFTLHYPQLSVEKTDSTRLRLRTNIEEHLVDFPTPEIRNDAYLIITAECEKGKKLSGYASLKTEDSISHDIAAVMRPQDWEELVAGAVLRTYNEGQLIYGPKAEQKSYNIYQVLRGRVRVEKAGQVVAILPQFSMFGEVSFVDHEPASADIVADETVLIAVLEGQWILSRCSDNAQLASNLFTYLAMLMCSRLRSQAGNIGTDENKEPVATDVSANSRACQSSTDNPSELSLSSSLPSISHTDLKPISCKMKSKEGTMKGKLKVTLLGVSFSCIFFGQKTEVTIPILKTTTLTWGKTSTKAKLTVQNGKLENTFFFANKYVNPLKNGIETAMRTKLDDSFDESRGKPQKATYARKDSTISGAKIWKDVTELTGHDWQLLLRGSNSRKFKAGDVVIEQNEKRSDLFYVSQGTVRVVINGHDVAVLPQGSLIGEVTFLNAELNFLTAKSDIQLGATASVIAGEENVVIDVMHKDTLFVEFRDYPDFSARFHAYLARKIAQRHRALLNLQYNNIAFAAAVLHPRTGISLQKKQVEGKLFPRAFSGRSFVQWLRDHYHITEDAAIKRAHDLFSRGAIYSLESMSSFDSSPAIYYCINEDDAQKVLEGKGKLVNENVGTPRSNLQAIREQTKLRQQELQTQQTKHEHHFRVKKFSEPGRCAYKRCRKGKFIIGEGLACTVCNVLVHKACKKKFLEYKAGSDKKKKQLQAAANKQLKATEPEIELEEVEKEATQIKPMASWEIPSENVKFEELLGEGTFGEVYRANLYGLQVAVKKLKTSGLDSNVITDFRHEVAVMSAIHHPNTILFLGACTEADHMMLVTEFAEHGTLDEVLVNEDLSWGQRLNIALGSAKGMNWLHHMRPPFIHRDLKTENILLDGHYNAKIADFGLSTFAEKATGIGGTPFYMAPEMILNRPYTSKVDVFSFALVLYCTFINEVPYEDYEFQSIQEFFVMIVKGERLKLPGACPNVEKLISLCWRASPNSRPNFDQITRFLEKVKREHVDQKSWESHFYETYQ